MDAHEVSGLQDPHAHKREQWHMSIGLDTTNLMPHCALSICGTDVHFFFFYPLPFPAENVT
jgi:hypothetical protein